MKKIDINTVLTIISFAVIATVSHMSLKSDYKVLKATTALNHKYVMQELKEIKTATTGNPLNNYADEPIVKKKKAYAGTPEGMYYEEQ